MYNSLIAKCRCGRPRTGVHVVKCLQKAINGQQNLDDNKQQNTETKTGAIDGSNLKVPPTSNAAIGWSNGQEMRYKKWEQSMKYISPVFTMEGPRITATPYNVLIIG
ncbi:uncharacterized protein LOC119668822 [Teleopsis dalmanni]|uniref:uncharacterized protein LOC119668524 n=1 Tax=Teleopsis dalmanni TaxID=139649 RepID=UPI0018CF49C9|nr:uncharacterized protein LOC119668524 [Teleopsis dalmanni]XP_037934395.1 uncharacterized protein LOC119668822 [Teleopsis dalmanni]